MEKTKANFRAVRDTLGLSQQDVADIADVAVLTVKRWEKPGNSWMPPDDVWEWLIHLLDVQHATVGIALDAADGHDAVQLTYYRSQEQYDALGRDDGPVGMANANTRLTASLLMLAGRSVSFSYPDDADNVYHGH